MNLTWEVQQLGDDAQRVSFFGAITENADFAALADVGGQRRVSIDLSGVEIINSCGVREWIHFIRSLAGCEVELVGCSPAIVRQLNTIANFRGAGRVRSVMLPYFCSSCRSESQRLLDLSTGAAVVIPEELPCPCGGALEFDDIPSSYISFAA